MPNLNNEGFAITPRPECVGGLKPVFWSDDNNTDDARPAHGHAQLHGAVSQQTITFDQPAAVSFGNGSASR